MTLRIPAKVLLHVWSYDFYDMSLSTGKQRRHMIKFFIHEETIILMFSAIREHGERSQRGLTVSDRRTRR